MFASVLQRDNYECNTRKRCNFKAVFFLEIMFMKVISICENQLHVIQSPPDQVSSR